MDNAKNAIKPRYTGLFGTKQFQRYIEIGESLSVKEISESQKMVFQQSKRCIEVLLYHLFSIGIRAVNFCITSTTVHKYIIHVQYLILLFELYRCTCVDIGIDTHVQIYIHVQYIVHVLSFEWYYSSVINEYQSSFITGKDITIFSHVSKDIDKSVQKQLRKSLLCFWVGPKCC